MRRETGMKLWNVGMKRSKKKKNMKKEKKGRLRVQIFEFSLELDEDGLE